MNRFELGIGRTSLDRFPVKLLRFHSVVGALFLMLGLLAGVALNQLIGRNSTSIAVRAFISGGHRFNLYCNEQWTEPLSLPVVAGQWHSYVFPVPSTVTHLRLDPSDLNGSSARIRGIRFWTGQKAEDSPLLDLISWTSYNATVTFDGRDGTIAINATGSNPFIMGALKKPFRAGWRSFPLNAKNLLWLLLIAGAIWFLLQMIEADSLLTLMYAPVLVLAVWAAGISTKLIPLLHLRATPPDDAISLVNYRGFSKSEDLAAVLAAVLICATVVLAGMAVGRRLTRQGRIVIVHSENSHSVSAGFLLAATLVFSLLSYPCFKTICTHNLQTRHAFDQDTQVAVMWHYLAHQGLLPFRDFWYPYGGMYNKFVPFRQELLNSLGHDLLVFLVLFGSIYILLGRRKLASAALCAGYVFAEATGLLWPEGSWRYLGSASVLVLLGAALQTLRRRYFIFLGIWFCYVLSQESAQAVYAAPGALFLFIVAWILMPEKERFYIVRMAGLTLVAFVASTSVYLASLAARHQLHEWWLFMSTLQVQSQYFAWPIDLDKWFSTPTTFDQFGLLLLLLVTAMAVMHVFRRSELDAARLVPAALAIDTYMELQKEILRTGMVTQIAAVPLLCLFMILIQNEQYGGFNDRERWKNIRLAWAAFAAGVLLCCFLVFQPSAWRPLIGAYKDRLGNIGDHMQYAFGRQGEWKKSADAYFSPGLLSLDDCEGEALKKEFQRVTGGDNRQIFALGDGAYWYLILHQPMPHYLNFFHQAPLAAQYDTVNWMASHMPQYVLWNSANKLLDGVPNAVRTPLLFTSIAKDYVPQGRVLNFWLLRRRKPEENPDLSFWFETLGNLVDLGHLPAISHSKSDSSNGTVPVTSLLEARLSNPMEGGVRRIHLLLGAHPLTVQFVEEPDVKSYWVRLDRLAQVAAAAAGGIRPVLDGPAGQDMELSIRDTKIRRDTIF